MVTPILALARALRLLVTLRLAAAVRRDWQVPGPGLE